MHNCCDHQMVQWSSGQISSNGSWRCQGPFCFLTKFFLYENSNSTIISTYSTVNLLDWQPLLQSGVQESNQPWRMLWSRQEKNVIPSKINIENRSTRKANAKLSQCCIRVATNCLAPRDLWSLFFSLFFFLLSIHHQSDSVFTLLPSDRNTQQKHNFLPPLHLRPVRETFFTPSSIAADSGGGGDALTWPTLQQRTDGLALCSQPPANGWTV